MCETCGCPQSAAAIILEKTGPASRPDHPGHGQTPDYGRLIRVEQDILSTNNRLADANRDYLAAKNILALNLLSSPGSGKTTLLEKTITALADRIIAVIEGDQQTSRDAARIAATGAPVVQVNTGTGCHLDAGMIQRAMQKLPLRPDSLLFIENVGNLVCPALFELGEKFKVVIISVTEGDDKPQKYPTMFQVADLCLINKTDLLPYVDFDVEQCKKYARQVNPALVFFEMSATTGAGLENWLNWLRSHLADVNVQPHPICARAD